jgi:hypothetical protein
MEGPCEHGNELSGSIKCSKFLSNYASGGLSRRAKLLWSYFKRFRHDITEHESTRVIYEF